MKVLAPINTFFRFTVWSTLLAIAGCGTYAIKPMVAQSPDHTPKKIAIFFDGTNNSIESDTNIKRLHSLVSLQKRPDIATLYIEGVGVDRSPIGMAMGAGIADRVKVAYSFLLDNYKKGDEIYVFGFSRGAYSARILTSLLHYAGLPNTKDIPSKAIADLVFDAVKHPPGNEVDRVASVSTALHERLGLPRGESVSVEVLGLWDTVEALGWPDSVSRITHKLGGPPHAVNIDEANTRYGDQLCNVHRAFQALALDDDREWIFTPLLLNRRYLFKNCNSYIGDKNLVMQEVWFSGAHADIGGGYDDSLLSGVSLNWMIQSIERSQKSNQTSLLPRGAAVPEDPFGLSHDPEAGWWGPLYHAITRNIGSYQTDGQQQFTGETPSICVHPTVFMRRKLMPSKPYENSQLALQQPGEVCLAPDFEAGKSRPQRLKEDPSCLEKPALKLNVQAWPNCTSTTWTVLSARSTH